MSRYEIEEVVNQPVIPLKEIVEVEQKKNDMILQPEELPPLPANPTPSEKEEVCELNPVLQENLNNFEIPLEQPEPCKHKLFGTLRDKNINRSQRPSPNSTNIGTYLIAGSIIATLAAKFI